MTVRDVHGEGRMQDEPRAEREPRGGIMEVDGDAMLQKQNNTFAIPSLFTLQQQHSAIGHDTILINVDGEDVRNVSPRVSIDAPPNPDFDIDVEHAWHQKNLVCSLADAPRIKAHHINQALHQVIWGVHRTFFCRLPYESKEYFALIRIEREYLHNDAWDSLPIDVIRVYLECSADAIIRRAMPREIYVAYNAQTVPSGSWGDPSETLVQQRTALAMLAHARLGAGCGEWVRAFAANPDLHGLVGREMRPSSRQNPNSLPLIKRIAPATRGLLSAFYSKRATHAILPDMARWHRHFVSKSEVDWVWEDVV
mmetsp:Transcript_17853/g.49453  ORF Transcript_17853/g.49453 Transcript_17853/m.49453 type:complete len:310 (+) Transcript_17853:304-1233(+)|eukprot:CAMPEP_0113698658 /NCGR_PEP_ID=MMETSP0038_2-20120614/22839_1 /TAXON_ID=2898 /ORGANISM="Cryptomonas paramecium" /LENGTH=309 /DNA_ID=CAMNT_0000621859 /DNA_START=61 /DNA_END=990 /DNA_ORIENTATION=- /assembly_acc=CAM_ASM_000170